MFKNSQPNHTRKKTNSSPLIVVMCCDVPKHKQPNQKSLAKNLTEFRGKHVKSQSTVTAKQKIPQLVFNPGKQKLIDFLDELQKLGEVAIGVAALAIIKQFT